MTMKKVNENDFEYRFKDHGPKYLTRGPNVDVGIVVLKSGQDFQNHYHTTCEEIFYILEGEIDFYINDERVSARPGDMIQCAPGDTHYLTNTSNNDFKALFVKSPYILERDVVNVDNPIIDNLKK